MQSFALPGVFSGITGLVPVAFHLAGVQRLPHLAQSPHDPFPGQHLHTSIPLLLHMTAEKSVHKTLT